MKAVRAGGYSPHTKLDSAHGFFRSLMATTSTKDAGTSGMVGRYELMAPIVSGALGQLWQARIASGPEEGRLVDIRRIVRSSGLDGGHVERLTNAGFAAMELRHPRIAAVLDVVVAPAEIAIVSEHIDSVIVQALVRPKQGPRAAIPVGVATRIALDLLEAIDAIDAPWAELFADAESEEERVLKASAHGGLVPDGLIVAGFGEAMLLETGLAGVALTIPALLDHPDVIAYRAPEQLEPGRVVDERADVFTVGILLWEMLSGRSLFGISALARPASPSGVRPPGTADAVQVSAARRRVLTQPIPRLDALPLLKKVSKGLADAVARCLDRDLSRRFQSARDAITALSALDAEVLSRHDAVATFVSSVGLTAVAPTPVSEPAPSSNRPTSPPVEDLSGRTPVDSFAEATRPGTVMRPVPSARADLFDDEETRVYVAPELDPSAGAPNEPNGGGSEPPTTDVDAHSSSAPSTDVDAHSPSAPSTDVDARAPSDAPAPVAERAPPSRSELDAHPPLAALRAAADAPNVEGSVTLMSGVAASAPGVAGDAMQAPSTVTPALDDAPLLGDTVLDRPIPSARRERSKKVVIAVMAGTGLLGLAGLLRATFSGGGEGASTVVAPQPAPPAATSAVASAALEEVASAPVPSAAAPSPSAKPKPSHAAPTSAPPGATAPPAETSAPKQWKHRPFKPTGI
jgi:serine/threonine protein kinase